jgi:hypothetical protein
VRAHCLLPALFLAFSLTRRFCATTHSALQYQNLAGTIPTSIGALTSLTAFRISQNGLGGTIPSSLGSLTALTSLKLHENVFTGTIPGELSNLSQLNIVNFGAGNRMQGTLPDQFFAQMSSLTELRMGGLSLSGSIPSSLCSLTSLVFADFSSSGFSGSLPSNIGQLTALTSLLIQANILSGSIPASFSSLTSLTEVVAWGNSNGSNSRHDRLVDLLESVTFWRLFAYGLSSLFFGLLHEPPRVESCREHDRWYHSTNDW